MKHCRFESAGFSVPVSGMEVTHAPGGKGDAFEIEISRHGAAVFASTAQAGLYAERALRELLRGETAAAGRYFYSPVFKIRALLEGFYGPPWTMEERRRALSLLSSRGMNTYFYGPKDDPFHRERWDELYPEGAEATLKEMLGLAGEFCMDFYYMLSPGLSIRYTSEEDMARLEAKLSQVHSFGVRGFALLLDDLGDAVTYEEDAAAFPRQVDAHIALSNRLFAFLKGLSLDNALAVCPTQYWGEPGWDYVKSLGRALPEEAMLFFTGEKICSQKLTAEQAEAFEAETGHRPLYWDNYPVNDMEMADELHLLPYKGRSGALGAKCEGIAANPMEFAEASLIPLMTVADCLWDGADYEPAASFHAAAEEVLGEGQGGPAATFAGMCYKSCLEGHYFQYRYLKEKSRNEAFFSALERGREAVLAYVLAAGEAVEALKTGGNKKFAAECGRWLSAAAEFCAAARELLETGGKARLAAHLSAREDVMKAEAEALLRAF